MFLIYRLARQKYSKIMIWFLMRLTNEENVKSQMLMLETDFPPSSLLR